MLDSWPVQQEVLQPCMGVPNKVGRFPMVWKFLKVCYLGTSCMGRSLVHRPGPFGLLATSLACTMWEHSQKPELKCLWVVVTVPMGVGQPQTWPQGCRLPKGLGTNAHG